MATTLIKEFGVTAGSKRAKLLSYLGKHIGKECAFGEVLRSVYGARNAERHKLYMVLAGLNSIIKTKKLPYKILQTESSLMLLPKGAR